MDIIDTTTGERVIPFLVDDFAIDVLHKNCLSVARCIVQPETRGKCNELFNDQAKCAFSFTDMLGQRERLLRLCQLEILPPQS